MAKHHRVLLLGPTGVGKRQAISRLIAFLNNDFGIDARFVDFENDFLKQRLADDNLASFLLQPPHHQRRLWLEAWNELQKALNNEPRPVILGLHATYISGPVGLRSPVDIPKITQQFAPSLIVTLIDDVYSAWRRTEDRAAGDHYKGRPTFEQLLVARRAEQLVGDIILGHLDNPRARHVLYAVGNTIIGLANLLAVDSAITYLSFPISAPRELDAKGDPLFIQLINEAHRLALNEMKADRKRTFISPLSIDELPIVEKAKGAGGDEIDFDVELDRWNVEQLWGSADAPLFAAPTGAKRFPVREIDAASGVIKTDVGWRDRRLVQQSKSLAVVCPKPPGEDRITRGVDEEVSIAISEGIVTRWWQRPEWDPDDWVEKVHWRTGGSMGMGQNQMLVSRTATLEKLIQTKP